MDAYFPKAPTVYNNGGATPNMTDARKTLDFQSIPGIAYISSRRDTPRNERWRQWLHVLIEQNRL